MSQNTEKNKIINNEINNIHSDNNETNNNETNNDETNNNETNNDETKKIINSKQHEYYYTSNLKYDNCTCKTGKWCILCLGDYDDFI